MATFPVTTITTDTTTIVQVTAAQGSGGTSLGITSSTVMIDLENRSATSDPIGYKVDAGPWLLLSPGSSTPLYIDLSKSTVLVRKETPSQANSIPLGVRTYVPASPKAGGWSSTSSSTVPGSPFADLASLNAGPSPAAYPGATALVGTPPYTLYTSNGTTWATAGAATVGAGSIDNTKLAVAPATTFKANTTGSAATPFDATVAQVKTALALDNVTNVAQAPASRVLTINGTALDLSADRSWTVAGGGGGAVSSVAGKTGDVTLAKADVGLSNVDNVADASKPVSTAQATAIAGKVPTTRTLTINGTALDLSADRSWSVSGGGGGISSSTWAARGTGSADGQLLRITDYGGPGGFIVAWKSSLSLWVLTAPVNLGTAPGVNVSGLAQTALQVIRNVLVPAGLLAASRRVLLYMGINKNGTADTITSQALVGTTGTVSDTPISPSFSFNQRSQGALFAFGLVSTTELKSLGGNTTTGSYTTVVNNGNNQNGTGIPDASTTALYFSYSTSSSGSSDTPIAHELSIILEP